MPSRAVWSRCGSVLTALLLLVGMSSVAEAQNDRRCFAETGFCIEGSIRAFWERNGGLAVFGLPITPQQQETIQGQNLQVQWFERNRLELHPENAAPYDVLLGRLGADRLQQQGRDPFTFPTSQPQDGCRYFAETKHNVCGDVRNAWRANGIEVDGVAGTSEGESLALWGLPLSDVQPETLSDGKSYQVQWFERGRFELHPENPAPANVLLGLLGNEVRQGSTTATPPPTSDPCADVPAPVSANITPRCGLAGTTFSIDVSGFTPKEEVGFWITLPDGAVYGTVKTVNIGPQGAVAGLPLRSDNRFPPGLYSVVFEGTSSKHQAIAYFKILAQNNAAPAQPAPAQPTPAPTQAPAQPTPAPTQAPATACDPSYPDFCIPPPPPKLNCKSPEIGGRKRFTVRPPDPHGFDGDKDGIGCEK